MLGVTMMAGPGDCGRRRDGRARPAAVDARLRSRLLQGLMIALYIAMDSFGTAGRGDRRGRRDRADRRPHLPQAQTARCRTGRPNGQRRITGQTALSATTRSSRLVRAAPSHPIGPRSLPSGDLDFAFPTPPRQYPGPDARRRRARKIPPTDGFPTPDEENPPKIRILSSTNPNRFVLKPTILLLAGILMLALCAAEGEILPARSPRTNPRRSASTMRSSPLLTEPSVSAAIWAKSSTCASITG